jgi:glyoxylase-like metal-dependent hydrolase (beta-lactamase superfamily II)
MSEAAYQFNVGDFRCMVVSDGTISDKPSTDPESGGGQDAAGAEVHHLNCLYIDTGEHKVLIDTGCGEGFQSTAGKMLGNLEAEGVRPEDIDRIIFTHGHIDHVGGACDAAGDLVFPNARFTATREEWRCWVDRPETSELQEMFFGPARKALLPLPHLFDLLEEGEKEILPGITAIAAPGHTPGLIMLDVSSAGSSLLCIGDVIHSQIEFEIPDYYARFDLEPKRAIRTREKALSEAAESGTLVFACHFAFPGLGHVIRQGDLFHWEPIKTAG